MLISTHPQRFVEANLSAPPSRRRVAIAGQVLDALTQQPIPGATVKIAVGSPAQPTLDQFSNTLDQFSKQAIAKIKWMVSLKPPIRIQAPLVVSSAPQSLEALTKILMARNPAKGGVSAPDSLQAWLKILQDGTATDLVAQFQLFFAAPQISGQDKWTGLEQLLYKAELIQLNQLTARDQLTLLQLFFAAPEISSEDKWAGLEQLVYKAELIQLNQLITLFQAILDLGIVPFEFSQLSPERTQTDANGWFYFLDLPEGGPYPLVAALPSAGTRYGETSLTTAELQKIVEPKEPQIDQVSVAAQGFGFARLYLVPTTIWGRVTDQQQDAGVKLARVQIAGQPEYALTFSADNPAIPCKIYDKQTFVSPNQIGYYLLSGLEAFSADSSFQISAILPGFSSQQSVVPLDVDLTKFSLEPGQLKVVNFKFASKQNSL